MEEFLLTDTDHEVFFCLFFLPPDGKADTDSLEEGAPIMATPNQTPIPSSSSGNNRRLVERPVDLVRFFISGLPSKPRFLLMSCTEEGKTLKSVSACRFARDLQQHIGEVQS